MEQEIWKDVVGYEGLYQVSNLGNIKSLNRICRQKNRKYCLKEKNIKLNYNETGYTYVKLSKNKKQRTLLVHRLVAQAFIPNPENKPTINHKNGKHDCNIVDNLEWATYLENNVHAYKNGLKTQKNRRKPILQIKDGIIIGRYASITQIKKDKVFNHRNVKSAINGKLKKYKGFCWRYE